MGRREGNSRMGGFSNRGLAAVALWLLASVGAQARTFEGVTMPDQMVMEGQTLQLNGMGLRTFTFLRVHGYVAGLYVTQPARDPLALLGAPGLKLLRVQYVHAASLSRVQDEMLRGRASTCAAGCPKDDDASFAQLFATAHAVLPGDTNTFIYGPDGVRVLFDDKMVATIPNPGFGRRMLGGMIGAHPPTAILRDGLLGITAG
jgi:hypothetical protein